MLVCLVFLCDSTNVKNMHLKKFVTCFGFSRTLLLALKCIPMASNVSVVDIVCTIDTTV